MTDVMEIMSKDLTEIIALYDANKDRIAAVNVLDFGAVGDGSTDDTAAIQAAIDYVESIYTNWGNPVRSPSMPILIPPTTTGRYKITGSLLIRKPITIFSYGPETAAIIQYSNVPAFKVNYNIAPTYRKACIRDLSIYGTWDAAAAENNQHGISYESDNEGGIRALNLDIAVMGGCGIYSSTANSHEIIGSRITQCGGGGIRLAGQFNTNVRVINNIIRLNRGGLDFAPDTGFSNSSGVVEANLFESNISGSGTLGSSTRPAFAIRMVRTQGVTIQNNYMENNMNDVYMVNNCNYNVIRGNSMFFPNANDLPQTYGGPPPHPLGPLYVGSGCVHNQVEDNLIYGKPVKPAGTTDINWGTSSFGASYEHINDTAGVNRYLYNITVNEAVQGNVEITNPFNRHTIINIIQDPADGSGRAVETSRLWGKKEIYKTHEIDNDSTGSTFKHLNSGVTPIENYAFPAAASGYKIDRNMTEYDTNTTNDFEQLSFYGREHTYWALNNSRFKWEYAASIPSDTTGVNGDITWNSTPVTGSPIGWVRTGVGWKGFGVIT